MIQAFDFLFLGYLSSVSMLFFLFGEEGQLRASILGQNLAILLACALLLWAGERRPRGLWGFLRYWYLCAGIPIVFVELQHLIHQVRPVDLDPVLARLDLLLFGVVPTVWLERYVSPGLTAFLQFCYFCYFFLPVPIGAVLYARDREIFSVLVTTMGLAFLLAFLGYLAVPALGPRYELASLYSVALEGSDLTNALIRWVDANEGVCRDCFPSGHVAMAVIVCVYAYRHCRGLLPIYLLVSGGLFLGTVYLRYHYVVDLPAGVLLAVICLRAAPRLQRSWRLDLTRVRPGPGRLFLRGTGA